MLAECRVDEVLLFVYGDNSNLIDKGKDINACKGPLAVLVQLTNERNDIQVIGYNVHKDPRIVNNRNAIFDDEAFVSNTGFTDIFSEKSPDEIPFLMRFCKVNGIYTPVGSTPCGYSNLKKTENMYNRLRDFYQEQEKLRLESKVSSMEQR